MLELPSAFTHWAKPSPKRFSWETELLGTAGHVKVVSSHRRAEEDRIICQYTANSLFTIVVSTYGDFCVGGENEALVKQIEHIVAEDLPIDRVIISWNPDDSGRLVGAEGLLDHVSGDVPIEIVLHRKNSLQNRFAFGGYLCTESVLHLDNDILIAPRILRAAFELHRRVFWDRILGFYCATIGKSGGDVEYISWDFRSPPPEGACDFVLTGLAFLARSHHYRYFDDTFKEVRENVVEKEFSGEDLLMNFVVAHSLRRETSIGVDARFKWSGRVGAAVFFDHRKCFRRRAIRMDYGHDARLRQNLFRSTQVTRRKRTSVVLALLHEFGRIVGVERKHYSICIRHAKDVDEYGRIDTVRPLAFTQWYKSGGLKQGMYHVVLDTQKNARIDIHLAFNNVLQWDKENVIVWILYGASIKMDGFVGDVCYRNTRFARYYSGYRMTHIVCSNQTAKRWFRSVSDLVAFRFNAEDKFVFPVTSASCTSKRCSLDSTRLEQMQVKSCFNATPNPMDECSKVLSATMQTK